MLLSEMITVYYLFQCVDNYPYLNRCPSGLYFDDINKLCTFKNEARCGPLPTSEYFVSIIHYKLTSSKRSK